MLALIFSSRWFWFSVLASIILTLVLPSIRRIGPAEVGLVIKRFSRKRLNNGDLIAFNGEAGYQADLLMPGLRWCFWMLYKVQKWPWVQVPAGQIGVVISQVGSLLAIGAKSGIYKPIFGNFSDVRAFVDNGGEKGVQRPVISPGNAVPIHPVAFLVITKNRVYGMPISSEYDRMSGGELTPASFGLQSQDLELTVIKPKRDEDSGEFIDMIGMVTALEGPPLLAGDIACRLNGFEEMYCLEEAGQSDAEIINVLLNNQNELHNNYQDYQAFLDHGGRVGLQHDPLLYGAFALNPFLIRVTLVPMLVIKQGEAAVIKAYVGQAPKNATGADFTHGFLVHPGHRGVWREPLRTGKVPLNPQCYQAEIVPTSILMLNLSETCSNTHDLDRELKPITAKSRDGFTFRLDVQVQIQISDVSAPRVISTVKTMQNFVEEILQAMVGNYFREKLQSQPAVYFVENRQAIQEEALRHVSEQLTKYSVQTLGVYIQDVVLQEELVNVLTSREIANQQVMTFSMQRAAQEERVAMESAKGKADMQAELAKSSVGVEIAKNIADAKQAEGNGAAAFIRSTGEAEADKVKALGVARAAGYEAQVKALGQNATALINTVQAAAEGHLTLMPNVLVAGSSLDGLAGSLMEFLKPKESTSSDQTPASPRVIDGGAK
ncbi:MAG TPA: SPFH domain-containing protein [Patescibacteria group bacterium]|nr:SPFH domain-containing protein [Patescibacteria group bacterium]